MGKNHRDAATLRALVRECRACGAACETVLDSRSQDRPRRLDFGQLIACAATFAVIAARLESGEAIPGGLVASAFTLAETTSKADRAMRCPCSAASNALRTFLDSGLGARLVV